MESINQLKVGPSFLGQVPILAQRAVFTAPGKVELESFSLPEPSLDEIVLETMVSVISPGTERAFFLAQPNTSTYNHGFPFYPGYSSVGRVIAMGSDVQGIELGQLLGSMSPHQSHVLLRPPLDHPRQKGLGSMFDKTQPTDMTWRLPDDAGPFTVQQCAAFIIATVSLYAVNRADIGFGDEVVILGLGPIGLFAGQLAKLSGALPVVGVARTALRRAVASATGFDDVYFSLEHCKTARDSRRATARTVVIEATGDPANVIIALEFCPEGATLVLLGSSRGNSLGMDFYTLVHRKAITIIGAHQPTRPESDPLNQRWRQYWDAQVALDMLAARRIDASSLISHSYAVGELGQAYARLTEWPDTLGIALIW